MAEILEINISLLLAYFLLHVPTIPLVRYKISILPHLFNAPKRLSSIHWKSASVPSHGDWIKKVTEIMEAEEWIAICEGKRGRFDWAPWRRYTPGSGLISSSLDVALLALTDPSFQQLVQANQQT